MNDPLKSGLGRDLVLDELFDLTLYQELHRRSRGGPEKILAELIPVETRHFAFWQDFFKIKIERLNFSRRFKLGLLVILCRLFGRTAVHLVLEGIEIYGVRKYLAIWETYKDEPLGQAVRGILEDEFKHEDAIVSQMTERKIDPGKIRSLFLGFNDGLVEILGAVSGFYAAFHQTSTVLIAASTVAAAGAFSMAGGAFAATSSEREVEKNEQGKARFLGSAAAGDSLGAGPWISAVLVGLSYLVGATVPVVPVFVGARTMVASILASGAMVILVSTVLAFLSGMKIRKRIATNLLIVTLAVGVTYGIGTLARSFWGINL